MEKYDKPIFVSFPGINGNHLVRVDRIISMNASRSGERETVVYVEYWDEGKLTTRELYSSATVAEIEKRIKESLNIN